MMRELIYYIACSVDGFIARPDGSFDGFLQEGEHIDDIVASFPETIPAHLRTALGITGENKCFDTVLMGRKTYEVGSKVGIVNPYPQMKQYVFSSSLTQSPDENVELVNRDIVGLVESLKQEAGKAIWLCGGGNLATMLFANKLIDGLILKVNPFLMGEGIPLFAAGIAQTALELTDSKIYKNGVLRLHYRVKRDYQS